MSPSTADRPGTAGDGIGFTVAITVWKREYLLPYALQSVFSQQHRCDEILVLSDGPSPETEDILRRVHGPVPVRDLPIRRQRKTHGNHLRRHALELATTSHVVILGHDCFLYSGYLAAHRANVGFDPDALSVVPVDYWRGTVPDGRMPRHPDVTRAGEAEIDLLCLALPRRLALEVGCFDEGMLRTRCADYLSYDLLRQRTEPRYRGGEPLAAHF